MRACLASVNMPCVSLPTMLQLRLLQEAIRREEDSLAEEHRREIQARAEADEAAKVAYYEAKQRLREQRLQQVRVRAVVDVSPLSLSLKSLPGVTACCPMMLHRVCQKLHGGI